jgi:two-component system chemotaxis response regulator CheY
MSEILIVDDSAFMRKLEKMILVKAGYKDISEASTGKDAIKKYKARKPDAVILDIIMTKDMSGIDVLRELKKIDKKARIIMVTILEQKKIEEEARKLGASDYISKPIDSKELIAAIKNALKN